MVYDDDDEEEENVTTYKILGSLEILTIKKKQRTLLTQIWCVEFF